MKYRPLTRPAMTAWLESYSPHSSVGITNHINECPISTFVKFTLTLEGYTRNSMPLVSSCGGLMIGSIHYDLPKWAVRFMDRVDRLGKFAGSERRINAGQALEILNSRLEWAL